MDSSVGRFVRFRDAVRIALSEAETANETEVHPKEVHVRIIQTHYNQLLNSLTSVGDIVAEIFQSGCLTTLELEYLQSYESTPIRASAELLNIIMRKPSDTYEHFLIALKKAKQQDAFLLLTATNREKGDHVVHCEHSRLIRQHYDFLTTNLSCDGGLIAQLLQTEVLTDREYEHISSKPDPFKRNEALLSTLSRKSSENFAKFEQALIKTGQHGVVEKLKQERTHCSDQHRLLIQRNFTWLTEKIEPKYGLVQLLYEKNVLTNRERETINSEKISIKANESLLRIIAQKPTASFENFKKALIETKQDHVVQKLTDRTVSVRNLSEKKLCNKQSMRPNIPSKPGKRPDVDDFSRKTGAMGKHPTMKIRFTSLRANLQKVENSLQIEISLKVTTLRQKSLDSTPDVFQMCLQTALKGSNDIILEMKKKREEEIKANIHEQKAEAEKMKELGSELQSVKKSLAEEIKQRKMSEKLSKKTEEMYEHMKTEFQKQTSEMKIASSQSQIDELNRSIDKEKRLREKAEEDFLQERRSVQLLKLKLEEVEEEVKRSRNNTGSSTESLDLKKVEKELRETRSELESVKSEKQRIQIALEKYNELKQAEGHSGKSNRFFMDMLSSLAKSTNDYSRFEKDRLDVATKQVMDLEKKLKLFEEKFALLRGKVTWKTRWTSDPQLVQTFRTKAEDDDRKGISGIAIVEKELYITNFKTSNVRVYDLTALTFIRKFTVSDLANAWDLAYCKTKKCLYVMDAKLYVSRPKNIMQLDLNGKILRSWSTQSAFGCISVTFDSNILFTSTNEERMVEYTPTGKLVREIRLSRDHGFGHLRHAMKLRNECYLVSFGDDDDPLHRVCVIDESANVKLAFGGKRGSNSESLNVPTYMAIDSNGSIIVVDRNNRRVLLLDSSLNFKREMIPRGMGGMDRPERMAVDESTGRLFIAHNDVHWRDSCVFVFQFPTKEKS